MRQLVNLESCCGLDDGNNLNFRFSSNSSKSVLKNLLAQNPFQTREKTRVRTHPVRVGAAEHGGYIIRSGVAHQRGVRGGGHMRQHVGLRVR